MIALPNLRAYQDALVQEVRKELAEHRSVIVCMPPGAGKTRTAKYILGRYLNRPKSEGESGKAAFMVHRRGLVENASDSCNEDPRLPHGIIMSGHDTAPGCDIQVASIDTKNSWYVSKGSYRNDFTYDLLILDECVSGDSLIETELGVIRIDQVPQLGPKTVISYSEEKGVHFASILNWKRSGVRSTIEIHTHAGKVRCTPDHEIYTRRGWLQAQYVLLTDEILAYAGAEENRETASCFAGGINRKEKRSSSSNSGTISIPPSRHFVDADVDLGLGWDLIQWIRGLSTVRTLCTSSIVTGMRTAIQISCCSLLRLKSKLFLEHCLEILLSCIQTRNRKLQGLAALMDLFRKSGRITRKNFFIDWLQKQELLITKDGVNNLSLRLLHVTRRLLKLTNWLNVEAKRSCLESGLMQLAISDLRGGYVTTEALLGGELCFYIQKVFRKKKTKLLPNGFATILERQWFAGIEKRNVISSPLQAGHKSKLASECLDTCHLVCNTNWSRVTKIVHAEPVGVFDIEVEKSHCFFANNLLVHNCHSHVPKFRTFLDAHNAKRAELGLKPPFILGLSATPQHKELNKVFNKIVMGPSPSWLIDNGFLSPFRYYQGKQGNLGLLKKRGDDYTEDSIALAMEGLAGDLVSDWKKLAEGRATVGFFPRRSQAYEAMELLRANGIDAHYVDGDTDDEERQSMFKRLNAGDIQYICNVGVIERGTDIPRIGCVQLCTAIGSVVRYRQMVGRGSRVHPDVPDCCGKRQTAWVF